MFCPIGQYTVSKQELERKMINQTDEENRKTIQDLAGTFLVAKGNLKSKSIDVYTHITRIENAYLYESNEVIVIGSDPLIVSGVSNRNMKPIFDSKNFTSFFELGYFGDENTPFDGVKAVPANTHIKVENHKVTYKDIDDSYHQTTTFDLDENHLEDIVNTLLNSFNILTNLDTVNIGLTGGKDSRLILLSLLEQGFKVNAFTNGFEGHPDVLIAQELANHLKVSHEVKSPLIQDNQTMDIGLYDRLLNTMISTSGQIFAYENISPLSDFRGHVTLSGVGGEILRGGYPVFGDLKRKMNKSGIIRKFYKYTDYYKDRNNRYEEFLDNYIDNDQNYLTNLYFHYLRYRMGRWAGDSRYGKSYIANSYMPFIDNQLVKRVMNANESDLFSGKLQFKIMQKLDKDSANIRYANNRFHFDSNGPGHHLEFENWFSRRPLYSTSEIGRYNWRQLSNNNKELNNNFKDILLDNPNNKIFDNVDYHIVEKMFDSPLIEKDSRFIWSLASMAVFINHVVSKQTVDVNFGKIELDLPQDTINEILPEKKIINLLTFLRSINDSLKVVVDESRESLKIESYKSEGKNKYLQAFKGQFKDSPNNELSKEILNAKRILINISMSKIKERVFLYVIFYSKGEQVSKKRYPPIEKEKGIIKFKKMFEVDEEIDDFRIALHFGKTEEVKNYKIYYAYSEISYK